METASYPHQNPLRQSPLATLPSSAYTHVQSRTTAASGLGASLNTPAFPQHTPVMPMYHHSPAQGYHTSPRPPSYIRTPQYYHLSAGSRAVPLNMKVESRGQMKHTVTPKPTHRSRKTPKPQPSKTESRGFGADQLVKWLGCTGSRTSKKRTDGNGIRRLSVDSLSYMNNDTEAMDVRELFPCMAELFDTCGCEKNKPKARAMAMHTANDGPRLETVCIDCGHVIEQHPLPQSLRVTGDRYQMGGGVCHHENSVIGGQGGYAQSQSPEEELATFPGYKDWQYEDNDYRPYPVVVHNKSGAPLPSFKSGAPRSLLLRPGDKTVSTHPTQEFEMDEGGRIAIPDFPDPE